jgi:hypothetical protein
MNARNIRNRLQKIERKIQPPGDSGFTLEELCRCMWREDECKFMEIAKDSSLRLFVHQFKADGAVERQLQRRE